MGKETGGPAFAASGNPGQQFIHQEGMTLRDYFAAKAMEGDWASQGGAGEFSNQIASEVLENRALLFYRMADAMLAARASNN